MKRRPIVFIIDDDHEDREIFGDVLKTIDGNILLWESFDPEEAVLKLKLAGPELPDLIFLDLNMPKINGMECLAILKAMDEVKNIPVYIYSTSSGRRESEESRKLGAASFITKTSDLKELSFTLRNILDEVILN